MKNAIFITIILLAAAFSLFGQQASISREEYYGAVNNATSKSREYSHRKVTKREYFENGKASDSNEEVEEHIAPDKTRFIQIKNVDGKVERSEMITIGTTFYCRKNDEGWITSTKYCGASSFYGFPSEAISKYWMEKARIDGKAATHYRQRSEWKGKNGSGVETLQYWQSKGWIDDMGRMIRREIDHGTVDSEMYRGKWLVIYDYAPKDLTIEAPTMAEKAKP